MATNKIAKFVPSMSVDELLEMSPSQRAETMEVIRTELVAAKNLLPKDSDGRGHIKEAWEYIQNLEWQMTDLEGHLAHVNAQKEASKAMLAEMSKKFSTLAGEVSQLKDDLLLVNLNNVDVQRVYDQARESAENDILNHLAPIMDGLSDWHSDEIDFLWTLLTVDTENEDPDDYNLDANALWEFRDRLRTMVQEMRLKYDG